MNASDKTVSAVDALVAAAKDKSVQRIVIQDDLAGGPSFRLFPGQFLHDAGEQSSATFTAGSDGLQFSSGNSAYHLHLQDSQEKRAIFNDSAVTNLGRVALRSVTTTGCVQILAHNKVRIGVPVFGCGRDKI